MMTAIWKAQCPFCFAGPGEPCGSMSKDAQRTKFRSDQKDVYGDLKRPHPARVLAVACPCRWTQT